MVSPWSQVRARIMGAALGTGARLASLPRMACGTLRCPTPSVLAQGCHSKSGPPRPVPLKKRGYDVTRNPHLNKVRTQVWKGSMSDPAAGWERSPARWPAIKPRASFQSPSGVRLLGGCYICFGLFVSRPLWHGEKCPLMWTLISSAKQIQTQ